MNGDEICMMDAVALAAAVRERRLGPVEVVEAVLERMDRLEPSLHAFCTPTPDIARAAARRVEAQLAAGEPVGPLAGVPVSVKDLILTAGIRTALGSFAYKDFVPDEDDIIVERLKAAGAIILGKTNVGELGYSATGENLIFPTTCNPWNLAMNPGGSSAGAGVAVAAGMGPIAIGSDGGGSVRIPASFCGVFGFKPSMGRIPLYPGSRDDRFPGASSWESLEVYGPLTRTVADAAMLMAAVAGPDPRDRLSIPTSDCNWMGSLEDGIRGMRIAYSRDWGYAAVAPEVLKVVDKAVESFERDLGCVVELANPGWDDPGEDLAALVIGNTDLRGMRAMLQRKSDCMSPHLIEWINAPWTAENLTDAYVARLRVNRLMARFMARYDLVVTPTLSVPPFAHHMEGPTLIAGRKVSDYHWLSFTYPMNMTGQPAASVPAGFTSDGLPVGLQIAGPHLGDAIVLRASAAFELAAPWRAKWPPIAQGAPATK